MVKLMVFFSSGSQCWYFSHELSSLLHHGVLVDLSVSMIKLIEKQLISVDTLTKLVNHYANRTLIVSCSKGHT